MATVTEYDAATAASTSNVDTHTSGSFSPGSVGELLVVEVIASGTVDAGAVTAAANGVSTFTRVDRATYGPTIHSVYLFVANQLTTGTAAMTVTFDATGDTTTGGIVMVCGVVGMTKTGATAIRQSTKLDDGAGATTPVFTFASACLTGNVTIYAIGEISTAGMLTPTNWTQGAQTSYSTPTIGGSYGYRASGFTGTTVTWPGNETAHGGVFVELDTSSSAVTGAGVASFGFTATGAGVDRALGVAAASFGFTGTGAGIDRALGAALAAFGFTATAAGLPTTFGTASAALGFTATASGIPRPQGTATASFGHTATAAGIPRVLGAALASLGFTGTASGTTGATPVTGAATATFGFTGAALGVDTALGTAVASFGFTATSAGIDRAVGVAVAAFGFTGTGAGAPTTLGTTSGAFGFTGTAQGLPVVLGVAAATFGFTGTSSGINPATFRDIAATATLHQSYTATLTRRAITATLTQRYDAALTESTLATSLHQPWEASLDA